MISELDDVVPRPVLVMTRIAADPKDMPELLEIAEEGAPILARQPGFVGGEIYKSADDTCLISLLRWRHEADHLAYLHGPDFAEVGARLGTFLDSGRARLEAHTLVRVGTVEPAP